MEPPSSVLGRVPSFFGIVLRNIPICLSASARISAARFNRRSTATSPRNGRSTRTKSGAEGCRVGLAVRRAEKPSTGQPSWCSLPSSMSRLTVQKFCTFERGSARTSARQGKRVRTECRGGVTCHPGKITWPCGVLWARVRSPQRARRTPCHPRGRRIRDRSLPRGDVHPRGRPFRLAPRW